MSDGWGELFSPAGSPMPEDLPLGDPPPAAPSGPPPVALDVAPPVDHPSNCGRGPPSVDVPYSNGRIRYYLAKQEFVAWCGNGSHKEGDRWCFRGRSALAGASQARGRPLGQLAAWLCRECDDRGEHMGLAPRNMRRAEREYHRGELAAVPNAGTLFEKERPRRHLEPEELVRAV